MSGRNLKRALSLIVLAFCFSTPPALAQAGLDDGFARYLVGQKEYYRAITEYYRLLYTWQSDPVSERALLKQIGLCYYYGEDYDGFTDFYRSHRNSFIVDSSTRSEMNLLQGKTYFRQKDYLDAIRILDETPFTLSDSLSDERYLFLAVSYGELNEWNDCLKTLQHIRTDAEDNRFREEVAGRRDELLSASPRSPALSAVLSAIVPGAGYFYCDRPWTGITALVVNGLFVWSIVDGVRGHQVGLSVSLGLFGTGWYVGDIAGSADAAEKYNEATREHFLDEFAPVVIQEEKP